MESDEQQPAMLGRVFVAVRKVHVSQGKERKTHSHPSHTSTFHQYHVPFTTWICFDNVARIFFLVWKLLNLMKKQCVNFKGIEF